MKVALIWVQYQVGQPCTAMTLQKLCPSMQAADQSRASKSTFGAGNNQAASLTSVSQAGIFRSWLALMPRLLQACRDLVALQLLPSISDAHAREVSAEATHKLQKLDSHTFPLGFTTGGAFLQPAQLLDCLHASFPFDLAVLLVGPRYFTTFRSTEPLELQQCSASSLG